LPHTSDVTCIAFSPDGRLLAGAANDGAIRLWNAQTGAAQRELSAGKKRDSVNSVAFSPDGQTLAAGGAEINLWDVVTGRQLRSFERQTAAGFEAASTYRANSISPVAFSRDGKTLAGGGQDGVTTLWNVADGRLLRVLAGHRGNVASLAFAADGRHAPPVGRADGPGTRPTHHRRHARRLNHHARRPL
jgi:WD40 repeat protein